MNKVKEYDVYFSNTVYHCKNKPELNVLLRQLTQGIGIIYPHSISFCIRVKNKK